MTGWRRPRTGGQRRSSGGCAAIIAPPVWLPQPQPGQQSASLFAVFAALFPFQALLGHAPAGTITAGPGVGGGHRRFDRPLFSLAWENGSFLWSCVTVQRWTAQLALVAYLLGGWIIPATHGVGSHAACSHTAATAVAEAFADAGDFSVGDGVSVGSDSLDGLPGDLPEGEVPQVCCGDKRCGFAAYRSSRLPDSSSPSAAGPTTAATWLGDSPCDQDHGLCAVCVAQNHASPTVSLTIELPAWVVVQWLSPISSQRFATAPLGVSYSRGPPAV